MTNIREADISTVPEPLREDLLLELAVEVRSMSSEEQGSLLLKQMTQAELDAMVKNIMTPVDE
jgi:hypothetical protein